MSFAGRQPILVMAIVATAFCSVALAFVATPPEPPKVSTFAPAEDLMKQMEYFQGRLKDAASNEADYSEAIQARVKKEANTLAMLALHLGMHDTDNPLKKSAPAVVKAAQELAKAADYQATKAAYADLEKALAGEGSGGELKWEKVADLGQVMKQVSVTNAALKRGLQPARIKSQAKTTTGQAAALAAIANMLLFDTHEVKNEADLPAWYEYSVEFRDSAGALNAAIKTGQTAKVSAALKRMSNSCETCHKKFQIVAPE